VICDTARNGNRDKEFSGSVSYLVTFKEIASVRGFKTLKMRKIKAKPVFTRNTEKVATEQRKGPTYFGCPRLGDVPEIPPGPRSTHGLSKWKCDRPECP
jgi:hypothetical protein